MRIRALFLSLFYSTRIFAQVDLTTPPNTYGHHLFPGYCRLHRHHSRSGRARLQQPATGHRCCTARGICLSAGATFNGGFILPEKTGDGWIILMSSRMDLLPDDETRIQPAAPTGNTSYPAQADAMPRIVTNNSSGIPCFRTQAGAHHYRFVGLENHGRPGGGKQLRTGQSGRRLRSPKHPGGGCRIIPSSTAAISMDIPRPRS